MDDPGEIGRLKIMIRELSQELEVSKRREIELLKAENYYRAFFEAGADGVVILDPETARPVKFNNQVCRQLGYSREEFATLTVSDIEANESPETVKAHIATIVADGFDRFETQHRTKTGEIRQVEVIAQIIPVGSRSVYHCIWRDITPRKAAEMALRESEDKFRRIFEASPDAVAINRLADGLFLEINKGFTAITGYDGDDVMGKTSSEVALWADQAKRESLVRELLEHGSCDNFETQFRRKDDAVITALVSARVVDLHGESHILSISRDISQRKAQEQILTDTSQRLADILDFLPDPIWVIDVEGRIIAFNQAMERMTGLKKETIIGKGDYLHALPFYGEPRPTLANLVLKRDSKYERRYLKLREEDGSFLSSEAYHPNMGENGRYLWSRAAKLYNTKGEVVGAVQSVRDITEAKRSQQDREQLIMDLQEALAKVKTLSGLLPICASCKKIRDDQGYWSRIEEYFSKHTDADFSHSICPECVEKIYGKETWFKRYKPPT